MQCEYLSYAPGRNVSWKCHHGTEGVRRAIRFGSEGLTLFVKTRMPMGTSVAYVEIPRCDWERHFGTSV